MKTFLRLITSVLLLLPVFCSCEKDGRIDTKSIEIQLLSKSTVYIEDGYLAEVRYRTTPAGLLGHSGVTPSLCNPDGSPLTKASLIETRDEGNGEWTVVVWTTENEIEDVILKVDYRKKSYCSAPVRIKKLDLGFMFLTVDGITPSYDEETHTYMAVFPTRTDFTDVHLSFSLRGDRITDGTNDIPDDCHIDFTEPLKMVLSEGDYTAEYTLKVQNTGLPIVRIKTPGGKTVTSKEDWMEGAEIQIDNADGSLDLQGGLSIKGRGNSTWTYPKKPYALKLDKKSKVLGMPKQKRWVLLANWKDRTLLRNDAAFWLSRQTGLPYTVRGQFVELELNGKHMGNYYLCEQIRIDENRVNIKEMNPGETDPEKITGGFLVELDTYHDYYNEPDRFTSRRFNLPYQFKQPDGEDLSKEAENWFKNYVDELENLLKDETRVKNHEYEKYMDVDSSIEYMFVEELATNTDFYNTWPSNGPHSCFLYKDRGGKLFHGPLWDFDYHGFVPDYSNMWAGATKTIYYPALYKDSKYTDRMNELWKKDKDKFYGLAEYIDQMAEKIRISEEVNHKMWPINNNENGDEKMTFDQAVARIKTGFEKKRLWMDANIKNLK